MFCDARFQSERGKRFESSAVPMVTRSGGGGKAEALLMRNKNTPLPVDQEMDVV
jgi:hypothetical protein